MEEARRSCVKSAVPCSSIELYRSPSMYSSSSIHISPDARRVDIAAVLAALESCHQDGQHKNPAIIAIRLLWGRLVDVDWVIRGLAVRVKDVPLPVHPHLDENGSMLRVSPIAQGRIRGNDPPRGAVAHVDFN